MDGDSLGELLGQLGSPRALSECLATFAGKVDGIVKKNDGRTVYAGGDDVLALVPASQALKTAEQLCDQYRDAFSSTDTATISAAIVFAHWRYPLRQVLRTAHRLLDDAAKDQTGRDSIALGIVLGSGLKAVWSVPWSVLRGQNVGTTSLFEMVEEHFGSDDKDEQAKFSASYLYLLRERFGRLFDDSKDQPGAFNRIPFAPVLLRDLAHAEYRRRMPQKERNVISQQNTQQIIDQLMSLSREWKRNKPDVPKADPNTFAFDGWRVARFLRQLQDGKVGDHD
jgi:CRISPR-associated protein Cmr2